MAAIYDTIGTTYSRRRATDPRIASAIEQALQGCASVLNVGAGTGSYEPRGFDVIGVEPSWTMIRQRTGAAAPVVQGRAEALPFSDRSFHSVLAVLTVHHWTDQNRGFAECARVARDRVVFFTIDLTAVSAKEFWLFEYFPALLTTDLQVFPNLQRFADAFASLEVVPVPIPEDCLDGFLGAYWRRPAAYLDPLVRKSISTFANVPAPDLAWGLERLRRDIESGVWKDRHHGEQDCEALDLGYRIVTCGTGRPA